MNPEIYAILQRMREAREHRPVTPTQLQNDLSIDMADLLVHLAEEEEKSTKRIVFLTWGIVALTAALIFTAFFDFPKIPIKTNQQQTLGKEDATKGNDGKRIHALPEKRQAAPDIKK